MSRGAVVNYQEDELGDIVNRHALNRRRTALDFWLRMTIPTVLLAGLVVFLVSNVPPAVIPAALLVTGAALLAGGTIGFSTGVRGPHWPIYALILTGLAVLLFLPSPWDGFAFINIPASAIGYATGKEVSFFRLNLRHPVSPVTI